MSGRPRPSQFADPAHASPQFTQTFVATYFFGRSRWWLSDLLKTMDSGSAKLPTGEVFTLPPTRMGRKLVRLYGLADIEKLAVYALSIGKISVDRYVGISRVTSSWSHLETIDN